MSFQKTEQFINHEEPFIMNEITSLQNAANDLELLVVKHEQYDKRKTKNKYFAVKNGISVSPPLDYMGLNSFLLGWRNANKEYKKELSNFIKLNK